MRELRYYARNYDNILLDLSTDLIINTSIFPMKYRQNLFEISTGFAPKFYSFWRKAIWNLSKKFRFFLLELSTELTINIGIFRMKNKNILFEIARVSAFKLYLICMKQLMDFSRNIGCILLELSTDLTKHIVIFHMKIDRFYLKF